MTTRTAGRQFVVLMLSLVATALASAYRPSLGAERDPRPNIVFMLADDQGWNGLSVQMAPDVPGSRGEFFHTPNIERLAAQGMRFSNAYAPAPVCSPTRISIQTGKSPAQLHWTKAAPPEEGHKLREPRLIKSISDSETTIGELLHEAGYATAHYGKWHIGGGGTAAYQSDEGPQSAIRFGNLKLLRFYKDDRVMLFDLARDVSERDDLAQRMPAEAQRLRQRLEQYLSAVDAQLPTPNPDYDPAKPAPMREKGKNKDMKRRKKA
jgi:arylsulfatase A-like enzyme